MKLSFTIQQRPNNSEKNESAPKKAKTVLSKVMATVFYDAPNNITQIEKKRRNYLFTCKKDAEGFVCAVVIKDEKNNVRRSTK